MPNRIVREGWINSPRIDTLDAFEERFFLRLILKADDFGRYSANPIELKNTLFPLKEDIRATDSSRWIAACEKAGLIRCYDTPRGRFLEIIDFRQRSRASVSKYPGPNDVCQTRDSHPSVIGQTQVKQQAVSDGHKPDTGQTAAHVFGVGVGDVVEGVDGALVLQKLKKRLSESYKRPVDQAWTYAEECELIELSRRKNVMEELESILKHRDGIKPEELKFFPNSIGKLMSKWGEVLDASRQNFVAAKRSPNTPTQLGVEKFAKNSGDDGTFAASFYRHWSDPKRNWMQNGRPIDWKIKFSESYAAHRRQSKGVGQPTTAT